jgi:hypothetical protein
VRGLLLIHVAISEVFNPDTFNKTLTISFTPPSLLFYHLELRCYVVIELKAGEFEFLSLLVVVCPVTNRA